MVVAYVESTFSENNDLSETAGICLVNILQVQLKLIKQCAMHYTGMIAAISIVYDIKILMEQESISVG